MKKLCSLFLMFFKIGAFTFGGGYAMIALLENEFITRRHWMTQEEFLDMTAIAESTPGPVAINSATYLGYRLGGVPGALISTIAVCLPSKPHDRKQSLPRHSGMCDLSDLLRRDPHAERTETYRI